MKPIAIGRVHTLAINGESVSEIYFALSGPAGDTHSGFERFLSGHDGGYISTSSLVKGAPVFNWRSWTGLSMQEIIAIEQTLMVDIPIGCLLENITFSGIPNFSKLEIGTRLVFPARTTNNQTTQAILTVWEENGPCKTVGDRLEQHHNTAGLKTQFVRAAEGKRGVIGFVLSAGPVTCDDEVLVYPPMR